MFTLFIFLAFLSLIFINRHASIKKPVKKVDYCDKMLIDIFDLNKKGMIFASPVYNIRLRVLSYTR